MDGTQPVWWLLENPSHKQRKFIDFKESEEETVTEMFALGK